MSQLGRDVAKYAGTDKRVLLCFMCDAYQPIDNELEITRDVIKLLRLNNIPFQVLTKGGMRAARDFDLYGPNDAFATTMTFLADSDSLKYEPGAALPADRIHAIQLAKERGIETWVSLEPVIEPEQSLDIIERTHTYVDLYKIGKLNHIKNDTNWTRFALQALDLCIEYGKPYYIKDDLAKYLDGIEFTNTDTRKIKSRQPSGIS